MAGVEARMLRLRTSYDGEAKVKAIIFILASMMKLRTNKQSLLALLCTKTTWTTEKTLSNVLVLLQTTLGMEQIAGPGGTKGPRVRLRVSAVQCHLSQIYVPTPTFTYVTKPLWASDVHVTAAAWLPA